MGKPDRKTVGLRLDPENDAKLESAAKQLSLSKSDVCNMIIRQTDHVFFYMDKVLPETGTPDFAVGGVSSNNPAVLTPTQPLTESMAEEPDDA